MGGRLLVSGESRAGPAVRPVGGAESVVQGRGAPVRHLGADDRSSKRVRVVDATLRCLARQGLAKTTLDDIAREAGLSRATLYRTFPGGKDEVLAATVDTELARLFSQLAVVMGEAPDLEEVLVAGMVASARVLRAHRALAYLVDHEPGVVLAWLAFDAMDRVLAVASTFAAPFLGRWLEPDQAARAAEWAARIVLCYLLTASAELDPANRADVERLVSRFVLPGVLALRDAPQGGAQDRRSQDDGNEDRPRGGSHRRRRVSHGAHGEP